LEVSEREVGLRGIVQSSHRPTRQFVSPALESCAVKYARQRRFESTRIVKVQPSDMWLEVLMSAAGAVLKELPSVQSLVMLRFVEVDAGADCWGRLKLLRKEGWFRPLFSRVRSTLREAYLPFYIAQEVHVILKDLPNLTALHVEADGVSPLHFDYLVHDGIRVLTLMKLHSMPLRTIYAIFLAYPALEVLSLYKSSLTRLPADWRAETARDPLFEDRPPGWLDRIEIDLQTDDQGEWPDRPALRFYDPVAGVRPSDLNSVHIGLIG
jgi:hypothetical protein